MDKTKKRKAIGLMAGIIFVISLFLCLMRTDGGGHHETIQEVMRDAVLHEHNRIDLFGLVTVNPGLVSGFIVTGVLLLAALLIRIFAIPKFRMVPGRFQLVVEEVVGVFTRMAKENSHHRNRFLGAYIFVAGVFIFSGTIFELFGVQVVTTAGYPMSLPAPFSDINGAIMMGCLTYLVLLSGGIASNGISGVGATLKEFSLPISMSFRLFGALLSGALVTELVYYYVHLSVVLPVLVGVLFTLLHAVIQAYVLTMLAALFYGEISEPKKSHKRQVPNRSYNGGN